MAGLLILAGLVCLWLLCALNLASYSDEQEERMLLYLKEQEKKVKPKRRSDEYVEKRIF